jgi:phage gpG-like protein
MPSEQNISGFNRFSDEIRAVMVRMANPEPAYKEMGHMLAFRVVENFRIGGNPPWPPSKRVQKHGGQTLVITGRLMHYETLPEVSQNGIVFGAPRDMKGATILHYGGDIDMPARSENFTRNRYTRDTTAHRKGMFRVGTSQGRGFTRKAYTIHIPARPAIAFTESDFARAAAIAGNYFIGR